jgi:alcohol dehydrogenase YqhD (iron-dependent ADH family)
MSKCIKLFFSDIKKKTITTDLIDENIHDFISFYENFEVMNKLESIEIEETKHDFEALRSKLKDLNNNRNSIIDPDHCSLQNL